MEPADQAQLCHKLGQQDVLLESQQQQLLAVMHCVQTISHQVSTLSTAVQAASPPSAARSAPVWEQAWTEPRHPESESRDFPPPRGTTGPLESADPS